MPPVMMSRTRVPAVSVRPRVVRGLCCVGQSVGMVQPRLVDQMASASHLTRHHAGGQCPVKERAPSGQISSGGQPHVDDLPEPVDRPEVERFAPGSTRRTSRLLAEPGVDVDHVAIYRWAPGGQAYRRYHRTATEIASRGKRKPANAEVDEHVMT